MEERPVSRLARTDFTRSDSEDGLNVFKGNYYIQRRRSGIPEGLIAWLQKITPPPEQARFIPVYYRTSQPKPMRES